MAKDEFDTMTGEIFGLNRDGHEVPDPRPMALPSGFRRPETLAEQVQRLVRTHISRQAAERGMETFEEAEDFDVEEDTEPGTPYETFFDPILGKELTPTEFRNAEAVYRQRYLKAQKEYWDSLDRMETMKAARRPSPKGERVQTERPQAALDARQGSETARERD